MKQLGLGIYEVSPGEDVTLLFTPTGISGELIAVSLDGGTLDNVGSTAKPRYKFTVNKQPGDDYSCKVECSFPTGTPATANVKLEVSGSLGGTTTPLTFTSAQPDLEPDFRVAAASASKNAVRGIAPPSPTGSTKGVAAKGSAKKSSKGKGAGKKGSNK